MEEKIAIITGGTGAVGRHIVNKFAAEGYKVYIPVNSLQKFMQVFDNSQDDKADFSVRKIFAFECNVLVEEEIKEFVEKVKALEKDRIDILVNTVGGFHPAVRTEDLEIIEFMKWFDLNFTTTFHFTKAVLTSMILNKLGRIISISSSASLKPMKERLAYTISKTGINALTEIVNEENYNNNIKAYSIIPGTLDTPDNRKWGTPEEIKKWLKPEKIAKVILEITKDNPKYINKTLIKLIK